MPSTAPCPKLLQNLQSLPSELRLDICPRRVSKERASLAIVNLKELDSALTLIPSHHSDQLEWTLPNVQPEHVAWSIATETPNSLYSRLQLSA